jgi:hypothetical protein
MSERVSRRRRWLAVLARVAAAALALWLVRKGFDQFSSPPSIWLRAALAFGLAKVAGDATVIGLFRDTVVLFLEDTLWELVAFCGLGLLAAGLIVMTSKFIGGPVEPYFPALVTYLVYLLAENRQRQGTDWGQ